MICVLIVKKSAWWVLSPDSAKQVLTVHLEDNRQRVLWCLRDMITLCSSQVTHYIAALVLHTQFSKFMLSTLLPNIPLSLSI